MKVKELLNTKICYFRIDIDDLPFGEAGLSFSQKYGYCRVCPVFQPTSPYGTDSLITGIYDFFSMEPINDYEDFKTRPFIFGQKLCFYPKLRGSQKLGFIDSEEWYQIELPHMASLGVWKAQDDDICYYYTDGYYATTIGRPTPKTICKNVKHLEDTYFLTHEQLKLFLFVEMLKIERKSMDEKSINEYAHILNEYWVSKVNPEDNNIKATKELILDRIRLPIFRELPDQIKEHIAT